MKRREFIALVAGGAVWPIAARAQLAQKIARVGIVSIGGSTADMMGPLPPNRTVRAFLRGMAELGYVMAAIS
jgi:putative ABC transport system substrate-binding protein